MDADRTATRRTRQRAAIAAALAEASGPLTVRELWRRARARQPGLGLATVYRELQRLQRAGDVVAVGLPGGDAGYEPSDRGHHHHFVCRRCGGVFDLARCAWAAAPQPLPPGFVGEGHELTVWGRCAHCAGMDE